MGELIEEYKGLKTPISRFSKIDAKRQRQKCLMSACPGVYCNDCIFHLLRLHCFKLAIVRLYAA